MTERSMAMHCYWIVFVCFCLGTKVPRHSAGRSCVYVYVRPQEHLHENMHARTILASAENIFLNLQSLSLRGTKERLGDKKTVSEDKLGRPDLDSLNRQTRREKL